MTLHLPAFKKPTIEISQLQLAVLTIYMIVAIDILGLTLVIPVLPTFTQYLGASQKLVGALFTVYSGCSFISGLYVPVISDKYGRRVTFLFAGCGAFAAFVGSGCSKSFIELCIWRGIAGLFTGTIGSAYAYIVDVVPPTERPLYMGYVSAVMSSCFVVGPLIGGGLASFGIRIPFYAASVVAGMGIIMVYLFIKNPEDLVLGSSDAEKTEPPGIAATAAKAELVTTTATTADVNVKVDGDLESPKEQSQKEQELVPAPSQAVPTSDPNPSSSSAEIAKKEPGPYSNPLAMLVGGLGSFLNTCTYTGFAVMFPLLLLDPSFNIVKPDRRFLQEEGGGHSGSGLSAANAQRVSLTVGYVLGLVGLFQAITMIFVYPRLAKRIGLIFTAAIGTCINGISLCLFLVVSSVPQILPLAVAFAIGNGLSRAAFPAYLGTIAKKGQSATYVSVSSNAGMAAMMGFAQISLLYDVNREAAFLLAGLLSVANFFVLGAIGVVVSRMTVIDKKTDGAGLPQSKSQLELFFGEGKPVEEFWADVVSDLSEAVVSHNLSKAITVQKGQTLIKEILVQSLPMMPSTFEERMEAIYHLYNYYGHEDWALGLASNVETLKHYGTTDSFGVPGAV